MRLIEWPRFLKEGLPLEEKGVAITAGVFDGVHLGHKALIGRIVSRRARGAEPVVVTFRQIHSKKKSGGQDYPGDILSFDQRLALFESLGVSITIAIEFTETFRRTSGADFLRILRERGKMIFMAAGSNFRCGAGRDTDAARIKELNAQNGVETEIVPPLKREGESVSSSRIRAAIASGNLKSAAAMLGYNFTADLGGAELDRTGGAAVYDIAGQGRVLPPDGKYAAFLFDEKGAAPAAIPAEILVENGRLVLNGDKAYNGIRYAEWALDAPASGNC